MTDAAVPRPRAFTIAACLALAAGSALAQQPAIPQFKASVDVTSIDVGVVDGSGRPVATLQPEDFVVRVNGQPRRVVSAEFVSVGPTPGGAVVASRPVPDGYTSNENTTAGRLMVVAIDQPNLRLDNMAAIRTATDAFIDNLSASDRMAIVGFGAGSRATPFSADRAMLKTAVSRMVGDQRMSSMTGTYTISVSEALGVAHGDPNALDTVLNRECADARRSPNAYAACRQDIENEAVQIAQDAVRANDQTLRGLRDLLTGLRAIEGPKTLVVISNGFVLEEGAPQVAELGALAAAGRTSVYALQLEDVGDIASARETTVSSNDVRGRWRGLELLASAARGAIFSIVGGGRAVFERVQAETSGYYLLGVESDPSDRDGKPHPIRIDVPRRGAFVRSRRQLLNAAADAPIRSARQVVAAGLSSPLLMSALPLRVATFALQGPEKDRVQLLIHADVGADYSQGRMVSIAYAVVDGTGRTVETRAVDSRLRPVLAGVPSPLQFTAGASLPPGTYTLKFVAAEGDRAGSVEHAVRASVLNEGAVRLSDLMAGGPLEPGDEPTPAVGYQVNYGLLRGYIEAYGPQAETVTVKYEVAAGPTGPTLLSADAQGQLAGDDRMIFSKTMTVGQLPPGQYTLRAKLTQAAKPLTVLTRTFEVAAPAVLMTSAEGTGVATTDTDLFLPVDEQAFTRPFNRDEALSDAVLQPFRERIAANVKKDFDAGVASIAAGDYPRAEASLKRAILPEVDSTPALAYLAVVFAASGHDPEAAAAWQTTLADGTELVQVYDWLTQSLLRTHSLSEARGVLEEAIRKWPADPRFTGPLAMVYALFGKGREAVLALERYLDASPNDAPARRLGVEWIYQAHVGGRTIHGRAEDLRLARGYAEAYEKTGGPQAALVRQWLDALEHDAR